MVLPNANGLPSEISGGRTERSETPCCHQETLEQDKIETNKLRTRRLGNTDFSFILYNVFSWTLSLLKHWPCWQSNWSQTCILHSYTIIGNWHAVTTCTKLELKVQHGNPRWWGQRCIYAFFSKFVCFVLQNIAILEGFLGVF